MKHGKLSSLLKNYRQRFPEESQTVKALEEFINDHPDCFERTLKEGHITGSAWIVNPERTHCILLLHRKLNRWLQPGGHADGDPDPIRVSKREALEETGLNDLQAPSDEIFDIDIHSIPARGDEPRHLHYDIRFLFSSSLDAQPQASDESKEVAWIPFEEVSEITHQNDSILRMAAKSLTWL